MDAAADVDPRYRAVAARGAAGQDHLSLVAPGRADEVRLAGTARRIWELLEYPVTAAQIAETLREEYDADLETVKAAVDSILVDFDRAGLVATTGAEAMSVLRDRYLWLIKRALTNLLYVNLELQIDLLANSEHALAGIDLQRYLRDIEQREPEKYRAYVAGKQDGLGPLRFAHTMIGLFRLNNIERCAETVFAEAIEGDFLEAGVCRGGAAIFMRALQVAHGEQHRKLWAVDSFEGVPPSVGDEDRSYGFDLEEARQPWLACSLPAVRENFRRYDLLDVNVRFVRGWIAQAVPQAPIGPLAILRLDVDLYSATAESLDLLYDKVSPGGFVIVDDYGYLQCCRDAVDHFRDRRGIREPIEWIDHTGIFWRKRAVER